jgi:hypothetical protein
MVRRALQRAALLTLAGIVACARAGPLQPPRAPAQPERAVVDSSATACAVSYDGLVWYRVPAGRFAPIDVRRTQCGAFALDRDFRPPRPRWAIPDGPTQARFVALSLQQRYSVAGMLALERAAARRHLPVTWLVGDLWWTGLAPFYNFYHAVNGDDAQAEPFASLHAAMHRTLPWYVPSVSVQGAGGERNLQLARAFGERAFWGIAWNSHGVDRTFDLGAPWGTYCADPASYKRPAPGGTCTLLAFEWTARDLTRAYLSGREDLFSSDPDDLRRAGMSVPQAREYVRALIDAYAAAGETQPLTVVSQQESGEASIPGDPQILDALYAEAAEDGLRAETLSRAAIDARRFSAAPRAVAFPYIPGGITPASPVLDGDRLYPATIDYHDARAGMTFLAGHTLPTRVFRYADDPVSRFDRPLKALPSQAWPRLAGVRISRGRIALIVDSPQPLHFGIALWSDPARLRIVRPGAFPAGKAGVVVTFDLRRGRNTIAIVCPGCDGRALPYST